MVRTRHPSVSNWIVAPGRSLPPCGLLNVSFWTYCCRFRSASPSDPPTRRHGVSGGRRDAGLRRRQHARDLTFGLGLRRRVRVIGAARALGFGRLHALGGIAAAKTEVDSRAHAQRLDPAPCGPGLTVRRDRAAARPECRREAGQRRTGVTPLRVAARAPPVCAAALPDSAGISSRLRTNDERRRDEAMKDDRQQHALASRDGGTDDVLVLVALVEVEMNHTGRDEL